MRLLYLATATLLAATSSASASPDTQVPFEIVNVLAGTQQVLIYDRAHNTHLLLAPGSTIDDYFVVEISGIGMTVEKDKHQFKVYPRAARGLALYLDDRPTSRPPAIYSTMEPPPAPRVADQRAPALRENRLARRE